MTHLSVEPVEDLGAAGLDAQEVCLLVEETAPLPAFREEHYYGIQQQPVYGK